MSWPEEKVLVVDRGRLFGNEDAEQGFGRRNLAAYLEAVRRDGTFALRADVEEDPSRKQIIPYVMVTHGRRLFLLKRLATQSEARLHNLFSIGVGGHINPVDDGRGDTVEAGLERELFEEVTIDGGYDLEPVGYLNDDSNDVGRVHFGLVFAARTRSGRVDVAERDRMEGRFVSLDEALASGDGMESWSKLLIEAVRDDPGLAFGEEAP